MASLQVKPISASFLTEAYQPDVLISATIHALESICKKNVAAGQNETNTDRLYKDLMQTTVIDKSSFDLIDKWIYDVLCLAKGFTEEKRHEASIRFDRETLFKQIGQRNTFALLCSCYQQAFKSTKETDIQKSLHANNALTLIKKVLSSLVEMHPKEYGSLDRTHVISKGKLVFKKDEVSPDFKLQLNKNIDGGKTNKKIAAVAGIAFIALMGTAALWNFWTPILAETSSTDVGNLADTSDKVLDHLAANFNLENEPSDLNLSDRFSILVSENNADQRVEDTLIPAHDLVIDLFSALPQPKSFSSSEPETSSPPVSSSESETSSTPISISESETSSTPISTSESESSSKLVSSPESQMPPERFPIPAEKGFSSTEPERPCIPEIENPFSQKPLVYINPVPQPDVEESTEKSTLVESSPQKVVQVSSSNLGLWATGIILTIGGVFAACRKKESPELADPSEAITLTVPPSLPVQPPEKSHLSPAGNTKASHHLLSTSRQKPEISENVASFITRLINAPSSYHKAVRKSISAALTEMASIVRDMGAAATSTPIRLSASNIRVSIPSSLTTPQPDRSSDTALVLASPPHSPIRGTISPFVLRTPISSHLAMQRSTDFKSPSAESPAPHVRVMALTRLEESESAQEKLLKDAANLYRELIEHIPSEILEVQKKLIRAIVKREQTEVEKCVEELQSKVAQITELRRAIVTFVKRMQQIDSIKDKTNTNGLLVTPAKLWTPRKRPKYLSNRSEVKIDPIPLSPIHEAASPTPPPQTPDRKEVEVSDPTDFDEIISFQVQGWYERLSTPQTLEELVSEECISGIGDKDHAEILLKAQNHWQIEEWRLLDKFELGPKLLFLKDDSLALKNIAIRHSKEPPMSDNKAAEMVNHDLATIDDQSLRYDYIPQLLAMKHYSREELLMMVYCCDESNVPNITETKELYRQAQTFIRAIPSYLTIKDDHSIKSIEWNQKIRYMFLREIYIENAKTKNKIAAILNKSPSIWDAIVDLVLKQSPFTLASSQPTLFNPL